jgi:succinoglycan biosynthesis protein ExoW
VGQAIRKIGVVIPYFQRERGILANALASIAAQDIKDFEVVVIVVDDASPVPPELELGTFAPQNFKGEVRVVRRPNGGPGAARNTGVEALLGIADYIALMDSDDVWAPHHLRLAASCLDCGADLFFSDYQGLERGKPSYLRSIPELTVLEAMSTIEQINGFEARFCEGGEGSDFTRLAATTFLAHLSTVMFSTERLGDVRSLPDLPVVEDHVYFLDLALTARRLAFTLVPSMAMGQEGVKIYASTHQWGTEVDLLRRIYNLQKAKVISTRVPWPKPTQRALDADVWRGRRTVAWLILRRTIQTRALPMRAIRAGLKADVASVLLAPFFAVAFLLDKGGGRRVSENTAI